MVWGEDFIPNVYLNGLEQSGIDRLGEDFIRTLKWVDAINQVNVKVINVDEFVSNIQKFLCPIRNTVSIIVIFLLFWRTAHDFKFGSKLAEQPAVGMHSKLRLSNAINGRDFVHVEVGEELHDDFRHLDISHEFWIVRLGDDCVDDFQGIQEGCDHLGCVCKPSSRNRVTTGKCATMTSLKTSGSGLSPYCQQKVLLVEGDRLVTSETFSMLYIGCCEPDLHGELCQRNMVRGKPYIPDSGVGRKEDI